MNEKNALIESLYELEKIIHNIPPLVWLMLCFAIVMLMIFLWNWSSKRYKAISNELFWVRADLNSLQQSSNHDLSAYMDAIERELANELMRRDKNAYVDLCESIMTRWSALDRSNNTGILREFSTLTAKYITYRDFDLTGTWPHVPYSTSFSLESDASLSELYADLRIFHALKVKIDQILNEDDGISLPCEAMREKEVAHARSTANQIDDALLLEALHDAKEEWKFISANAKDVIFSHETAKYVYTRIPAESPLEVSRIGIYVKPLDRFGIWSSDILESGRYDLFWGSNEEFSEERGLEGYLSDLDNILKTPNQ